MNHIGIVGQTGNSRPTEVSVLKVGARCDQALPFELRYMSFCRFCRRKKKKSVFREEARYQSSIQGVGLPFRSGCSLRVSPNHVSAITHPEIHRRSRYPLQSINSPDAFLRRPNGASDRGHGRNFLILASSFFPPLRQSSQLFSPSAGDQP